MCAPSLCLLNTSTNVRNNVKFHDTDPVDVAYAVPERLVSGRGPANGGGSTWARSDGPYAGEIRDWNAYQAIGALCPISNSGVTAAVDDCRGTDRGLYDADSGWKRRDGTDSWIDAFFVAKPHRLRRKRREGHATGRKFNWAVRRGEGKSPELGVAKTSIAGRPTDEIPHVETPDAPIAVEPAALPAYPLTVLIAVPTIEAGAADEGAVELAQMLCAAGHRAIVVTRGGRLEPDLAACGGEMVRLDTASRNPLVIARNAFVLRRLVAEPRCTLVHARARAPAWSALAAARMAGVPFVTTWYNAFREQNIFKRFYNSVMARGERVIAMSDQIADAIAERHGIAAGRIVVAPPHIDVAWLDPARMTPQRVEAVRAAWGVGAETRAIMAIGCILRRKGHHVIVRAARRLKDMGLRDFAFVLVGEDHGRSSYSGELWDMVVATGTSDEIRIVGPPEDGPAAYGAAVAVVSAAIQLEGPQRSLLEAMAMARPVIASDLAAGPETVLAPPAVAEDRMTGLRFPPGDDGELAAALIRLLSAPESTRSAIGRRGRERVMAEFANAGAMTQMLAVYAEIARPRP
jgi:glycosyltransferase involved in cell wall biosynthesis